VVFLLCVRRCCSNELVASEQKSDSNSESLCFLSLFRLAAEPRRGHVAFYGTDTVTLLVEVFPAASVDSTVTV